MNERINALFQVVLVGVNYNWEEAYDLMIETLDLKRKGDTPGVWELPDGTLTQYYVGENGPEFTAVY